MSNVMKSIGTIAAVALGVAAVVFTAGAAIPAVGAIVGAGGFSAAVGGVAADLGLTGTLGSVLTGAVTSAGFGSAGGALLSGIQGKDPLAGATSGAEMGAVTGGLMAGAGAALGGGASSATDALAPVSVTPMNSGMAANIAASSSAPAASVADATGAATPLSTVTAPVNAVASNGSAANGAGGLTNQGPTTYNGVSLTDTPNAAGNGAAGTSLPSATVQPNVQQPGLSPAVYQTPSLPAGDPAASPGVFDKGGLLDRNSGLATMAGSAISGIGQGLGTASAAQDTADAAAKAAKVATATTQGNYGQTTDPVTGAVTYGSQGGLLTQAKPQTRLPSPSQAFNPSSRWVFDNTSKKLVLVPPTGAAS